MGNNTGIIYGRVPNVIKNATVDLNWVMDASNASALRVGGDSDLTTYVQRWEVKPSGNYILPFYWQSYQVPGDVASALALKWDTDGSYVPLNIHGTVRIVADLKKMLNGFAPDGLSTDPGDATRLFWTFWMTVKSEFPGLDMLIRFLSSGGLLSTEQVAIACRIDF